MRRDLIEQLGAIRSDFIGFAAAMLKVKDKDTGTLIPFKMNVAQIYAHKRMEDQKKRTGRVRVVVSKGRQQGMSTYTEGRFYWRVTGSEGKNAFILTHEQSATDNLFGMVERFHANFPEQFRATVGTSNAKELQFKTLGSGYKVGTAGNKSVGRSSTVHFFHGSETGFWPAAEEHLSGILQAVPDAAGTEVILESTSNGVGGVYYDYAMEALAGDGDYELIFVPWYWQPEYRKFQFRQKGEVFTHKNIVLTEEEEFLIAEYDLDNAQILWRRSKIHELKSDDLFKQEYPCLTGDTKISTKRGFVRMDEIVAGDECDRGLVQKAWCSGEKESFLVTTRMGFQITATAEHPVSVGDDFVPVRDLMGEKVNLQPPIFAAENHTARWNTLPCVEKTIEITPDIGRFLGYFMGDGSYHSNTLSIVCTGKDVDVIEDVKRLFRLLVGEPQTRVVGDKKNGVEVRKSSKESLDVLDALGCVRRSSNGIKRKVCVPECIWKSPRAVVVEFLRALMEADGFADYGQARVVLFSKYPDFIQDVQLLLLGFGVTTFHRELVKNKKGRRRDGTPYEYSYEGHELTFRAAQSRKFGEAVGFLSDRKQSRVREWIDRKKIGRPELPMLLEDEVVSIVPQGVQRVYDIEVKGSHVFGANGVLVHNCTVMESFIASGRGVFAGRWLEELYHNCFSPMGVATVDTQQIIERSDGELYIWENPKPGERYYIGADVAEGLLLGDYSTAQVVDSSGDQVAEYRAHVDPDLFADHLKVIGIRYNKATLAVERNNHGLMVINRLARTIGYPRIYMEEAEDHMADGKIVRKYGWLTTKRTKPMVIDNLVALVRDEISGVVSARLVEEMQTYIVEDRGSTNAQAGKHDDLLMAYAIAQFVRGKNTRKPGASVAGISSYATPADSVAGY